MLKPNMIPDEVVEAAIDAMSDCGSEVIGSRMARASIAAALNAWPGADQFFGVVALPLPQEARDG